MTGDTYWDARERSYWRRRMGQLTRCKRDPETGELK
jgi:hypothetical protein